MKRIPTSHALVPRIANLSLAWCCLMLSALCPVALAEPHDRLTVPLDSGKLVRLGASRNPGIDKLTDEGAVAPTERIRGLRFRFKPTAGQSAALERLLDDQQNAASPLYHAWLTPEEYADRFGLSQKDLERISDWLESEGFQIETTACSRTWIAFNATAGQIRRTFKTEIHRFRADGQRHYANTSEAQIPAALEPLVYNLSGLNDFRPSGRRRLTPQATFPDGRHALSPGDLATIYNVNPLLEKGFDGSGQKIVVVGASAIELSDIRKFRNNFNLPVNDPKVILAPGSPDPGTTDFYDEATADVEIAGASAPKASVLYVYAENPFDAAQYAVDQNLAPVISYSFYLCEKVMRASPADLETARAVARQANAQGITWLACSGDSGAAACEPGLQDLAGQSGAWVSLPASLPEVTAVGGTMFADDAGDYWNVDPTQPRTARSYVPEIAWNETPLGRGLAASGGGASYIFGRPAWQTGPGVPRVNARLVPDISFAGAWFHDPYMIVSAGEPWWWGGTSAATPFFAGVVSILNQYVVNAGVQAKPGLGNINPRLYELARTTTGVFHDITAGNNIVPCRLGTDDCTLDRYGYVATPGYDLVTGLGSLDVYNFVLKWAAALSSPAIPSTSLSLAANPATVTANGSTVLTATVRPATGASLPTGTVSFSLGQTVLGSANLTASGGAAAASLTVNGSQLAAGVNTIRASYGGFAAFSSSSGAVEVTVTGAAALVAVSAQPSTVYQQAPDVDGFAWQYRLQLADSGGLPSIITEFSIDDTDSTSRISLFFGSTTLPAFGSLSAAMRGKITAPPADHLFAFAGIDAAGKTWRRGVVVHFLAGPSTAALSLTSSPATVRQSPKGDQNCPAERPLYQQLILQEQNGIGVRLTRLAADGKDVSDQIGSWFGSFRLPPFGVLRANFCSSAAAPPAPKDYEVDGIDARGQTVKATLQVTFKIVAGVPGTLTVSKKSVELAASGPLNADLDITLPADEAGTISTLPANQKTRWLTVTPTSSRGPARVSLAASASGLANGVYTATLVFQSENTVPQIISVPVVFSVGASGGTAISAAQNAASFQPVFAPGMLMSVFGTKLANTTQSVQSLPLPLLLDGVSATVNGVPAPLWFISPGQINLQIPYETAIGSALVVVNNNGGVASYAIQVTATAPGVFNSSGQITAGSVARGGSVSLYITGEGETTPMLDTGAAPPAGTPASELPKPLLPVKVTVGGMPAEVTFIGNPGLVGATQLIVAIPPNVPRGAQPLVVTVGGVSSVAETLTVM
jgi:uncharacterized protein (TIGR03437 family)